MQGSSAVGYENVLTPPTGISPTAAIACVGYDDSRRSNDRIRIHTLPANIARLVRVRNFVNCRLPTYRSSAVNTENSSCQSGALEGLRNHFMLPLPCVIRHVDRDLLRARR